MSDNDTGDSARTKGAGIGSIDAANLSELKRLFSSSVNKAFKEVEERDTVTPAALVKALASVHPEYGNGKFGDFEGVDPNGGTARSLANLLQDVTARHDIAAMRRAGHTIHTGHQVQGYSRLPYGGGCCRGRCPAMQSPAITVSQPSQR